ncbi:DUF551 domain-containing protein [Enterobacter roggenkampii]|uniref:DUF551 domain-containing protein n=1 Tax=Enterobacter roggenkampii TaxID=1812935 RepID=UPI002FF8FDB3
MSTITREFTKEQLQQIIETDHVQCGEASALARIALASLEAEPVCVIDQSNLDYLKSGSDADVWPASRTEMGDVLLYRAAPPAPVSVPDEDLLHMAASAIEDLLSNKDRYCAGVWADIPAKLRRAAMLQGAGVTEKCRSSENVQEVQEYPETLPCSVFLKPGLRFGKGVPTRTMLVALRRRSEYYSELEAMKPDERAEHDAGMKEFAAMLQDAEDVESRCSIKAAPVLDSSPKNAESRCSNSPVIPDGWIPVSERMPGSQEWVIVFAKWDNQQVLCWDDVANRWTDFEDQSYYADMFTHWMPLPAAPQQEVNNG